MSHTATNPLLDLSGLPRFAEILPEHVAPAIDQLILECRTAVESAVASAGNGWDDFVAPLEDINERLSRAWGVVSHLHAVIDSPAMRDAYNASLPKVTEYWTDLGQNLALFNKYRALNDGPQFAGLSSARKKIIENELRDFRLSGAELPDDKKTRFKAIAEEQLAADRRPWWKCW